MSMSRQAGRITLALVLVGAAFGAQFLRGGAALEASSLSADDGVRAAHEVVVFRTRAWLDDRTRMIDADVLRTGMNEVSVAVNDLLLEYGTVSASGRRIAVRDGASREPVHFVLSQDERTVSVVPDGPWGSVHRDTGLGVTVHLLD